MSEQEKLLPVTQADHDEVANIGHAAALFVREAVHGNIWFRETLLQAAVWLGKYQAIASATLDGIDAANGQTLLVDQNAAHMLETWRPTELLRYAKGTPTKLVKPEADDIIAEFAFLYRQYGLEADGNLAPDGLELKRKVLAALSNDLTSGVAHHE